MRNKPLLLNETILKILVIGLYNNHGVMARFIYTFGSSSDGFSAFAIAPNPPSWLKGQGQYFIWTTANGYPSFFPNGAYHRQLVHSWLTTFLPNETMSWIPLIEAHESYCAWWEECNLTPYFPLLQQQQACSTTALPIIFWAGWYDIFLSETLLACEGFRGTNNTNNTNNTIHLRIDPLGPCQGAIDRFNETEVRKRKSFVYASLLGNIRLGLPSCDDSTQHNEYDDVDG